MEKKYLDLEGLKHYNGKLKDGSVRVGHAAVADQVQAGGIQWGNVKVPLANIPQGALERMIVVADDTARFRLTLSQVQQGDTVKVTSTNKMYFVKDESNLNKESGYEEYAAGVAAKAAVADSVAWGNVSGKPAAFIPDDHASNKVTSLAGYAKGTSTDAILPSDNLNQALAKLENRIINGESFMTLEELKSFPATNAEISSYLKERKSARRTLIDSKNNVLGVLDIYCDVGQQLITEVLESRIADPNATDFAYTYKAPRRFYRHLRVKASESNAPWPAQTWTQWQVLIDEYVVKKLTTLDTMSTKVDTLTSDVSGIKRITESEIDGVL